MLVNYSRRPDKGVTRLMYVGDDQGAGAANIIPFLVALAVVEVDEEAGMSDDDGKIRIAFDGPTTRTFFRCVSAILIAIVLGFSSCVVATRYSAPAHKCDVEASH